MNMTKNIEDVMTKENLVTAKEGVTLEGAQQILKTHKIEKLPIVDEEGHLKGLITIKDIEKKIQYPNSAKDERGRLLCGAAVGIGADLMDKIRALVKANVARYSFRQCTWSFKRCYGCTYKSKRDLSEPSSNSR